MPIIGLTFAKAKAQEVKHRLREIKFVLEYPNSKVSEALEKIINDMEDKPQDGKKLNITSKKEIKQIITVEDKNSQEIKCKKIMDQIQKQMRLKKMLAEQDSYTRTASIAKPLNKNKSSNKLKSD